MSKKFFNTEQLKFTGKSSLRNTEKYAYCQYYLYLKVWLHCRTHWLNIKVQARIFQMDALTRKRNQGASIDVCCEAIDQNFDCGCVFKFGITGLKSSLRATKNMHIVWATFILPHNM